MSDHPVEFDRVTHHFGATRALHSVSFAVPAGSIFALLGRNGAGKTTAMRCLLGFTEPTRGRCRVLGHDSARMPPELRSRIGYVAEGQSTVGWMRLEKLVEFQNATFPGFDAGVESCPACEVPWPDPEPTGAEVLITVS